MTDIPAFPRPFGGPTGHEGMSLRDYFAAAALTGFCGNTDLDTREEKAAAFANDAYAFADAMLAERLKTKK